MTWNWEKPDWPKFNWTQARIAAAEEQFLLGAGVAIGTIKHLGENEQSQLVVELMSAEAITTSAIEGEALNRASVQSSILNQLGLGNTDKRHVPPAEQGIAEVMVDLYRSYSTPLTDEMLFGWHRMVTAGRRELADIGRYRTSAQPMQIVSGPVGAPNVHFEAVPSKRVPAEMRRFIEWFNRTAPGGKEPLSAIARAGTAHLYFESIHPFEDGNGRIGRALVEKALTHHLGHPVLLSVATTLLKHQKNYYQALEKASRENEITEWLVWFSKITLEAQHLSLELVEFVLQKTKMFDRLNGKLNERQEKVLLRMFREGPKGFTGGLSAGKYSTITGASPATTTRDLSDLVEKGALIRTGERRHARYTLNLQTEHSAV